MSQLIHDRARPLTSPDAALVSFLHPDDVLAESALTSAEKRAILASWASDERTVLGEPTLRQLPSGAIVRLDEIRRALVSLDRLSSGMVAERRPARWSSYRRARIGKWLGRRRPRWGSDDDDPPPAPAASARPILLNSAA
jgi:hypothetical protein